jgi:hypothetical protein
MPFSGYESLVSGQSLTETFFNSLRDSVKTSFDHGITSADLTWPLRLQGPIDFSEWTLKNLTTLGTIIFADKYATLQAAVNAAHVNGGGVVLLGPRTYTLSTVLDMQNASSSNHNVQLIGCGAATKLVPAAGFASTEMIRLSQSTTVPAQRMVLSNFLVDCTGVAGSYNVIDTRCCEDSLIAGVIATGFPAKGIVLDRSRRTICEYNQLTAAANNTCISLLAQRSGDDQVLIRHNRCEGMLLDSNQAYYIKVMLPPDSIITDNSIEVAWNKTGIHLTTNGTTALRNVTVARNSIVGYGGTVSSSDTQGRGITVEASGSNFGITGFEVMNNFVRQLGQDGIQIVASDNGVGTGVFQNFTLCGNYIHNVGRHGIRIRNQCKFGSVFGNIIASPNANNASGRGLSLSQTSATFRPTYISMVGNVFTFNAQDHANVPTLAIEGSANVGSCLINGNNALDYSTLNPYSLPAALGNQIGENLP